jgi:DNA-binding response OmpR family regulator
MPRLLLLSEDEEAVEVLTCLLRDLDIDVDHYARSHVSAQQLVEQKFDAIVVDGDNEEDAAPILHTVAALPSGQRGLLVVLARTQTEVHFGFSVGAHIALYKPISVERVGLGLRTIRNLISRERRRGLNRLPVNIPASLGRAGAAGAAVVIVDLSDSGAVIHSAQHIPSSGLFTLHCLLSDTTTPVMFTAEVVWQDAQDRSGIRFVNVASGSRQILTKWLKARLPVNSERTGLRHSSGLCRLRNPLD